MTTYTLTGLGVHRSSVLGQEDDVLGITQNIQLQIVMPEGDTSLSYSLLPQSPGDDIGSAELSINASDARISGNSFTTLNQLDPDDTFFVDVTSPSGNATVFGVYFEDLNISGIGPADTDFLFVIDGALPQITTAAQWEAFDNAITSVSSATGNFGPGVNIPLTSLGAVISQNDLITGTDLNENFAGGIGNDTIFGGLGNDTLDGGAGNDVLNPGDNTDYDQIMAGPGNDTINFSDLSIGYADVLHEDLNAGITVNINGNANTGSIAKGANGNTALVNVANPIAAGSDIGGLGISGTGFDDSFNVTSRDDGWMSLAGLAGDDTFTIGESTGSLRLDYRPSDGVNGIVANLATGVVSNDGFGDTDTIQGAGRITELRTSMQSDSVQGTSGNDSFILMAGNDTLDAGAGFDRLRYDRTGVEAVTVDLSAGTATGVWRGEAFNHTISGVEYVRGSNIYGDTLIGDSANNLLDGRNGDDTLAGGMGDDTLYGGDATDTAIFTGARAAATVSISGMTVTVTTAGGGTDIVTGVEKFQFDDGTFDFNINTGIDQAGLPGDTVEGSSGSEMLIGTDNNDTLRGFEGNDRLDGGLGEDVLDGGPGNDRYIINSPGDTIEGEIGYSQGGGIDTVESSINYALPRNLEILRLQGTGDLNGSGGYAPEAIVGQNGNNVLNGGGGDDVITAKAGDDTLIGGLGADSLVGDEGADVFDFNNINESRPGQTNRDFINGFVHGEDKIDLSDIDANINTSENDAFFFIDSVAFHGVAGELRFFTFGGGNYNIVEADVDGDGNADMQVFVNLTNEMFTTDFIL